MVYEVIAWVICIILLCNKKGGHRVHGPALYYVVFDILLWRSRVLLRSGCNFINWK